MTQKCVHKLRATAILQTVERKGNNCVTLCFDLQIQPLLKAAVKPTILVTLVFTVRALLR